jgi:preprotein translocase subunit YajC
MKSILYWFAFCLSPAKRTICYSKFLLQPEFLTVITPAFAQAASTPGANDLFVQMMPFVLIFIIMYFLLIRPQQKRVKTHQEMIKNVRKGDSVVLNSGMIGKVTKIIDDNEAEVEIADGVKVKVIKSMIADVRNKSEPVAAA